MVDYRNLDMFQTSAIGHITHTNSSNGKKTYHRKHGSYYGMILTFMCVTILIVYLYFAFKNCFDGIHDTLDS